MKKIIIVFGLMLIMASGAFAKGKMNNGITKKSSFKPKIVGYCCKSASVSVTDSDGNTVTGNGSFCSVIGCGLAQMGADSRAASNLQAKLDAER